MKQKSSFRSIVDFYFAFKYRIMKVLKWSLLFVLAIVFLTGCFADTVKVDMNTIENYPTFLMGLWHGIICPVTFVLSLFSDSTAIYQAGGAGWYDFGFLIGVSISFGGGGHGASRARRKR